MGAVGSISMPNSARQSLSERVGVSPRTKPPKEVICSHRRASKCHSFPTYYLVGANVEYEEVLKARIVWNQIVDNTAPYYLMLSEQDKFEFPTCADWFSHHFFDHLFNRSPDVRRQFGSRDLAAQGGLFIKMISICLDMFLMLDDRSKLKRTLKKLAKGHSTKGVVSAQYGIVGETLFWTLEYCIGPDYLGNIWLRIYSIMLKTIIPAAIVYEKRHAAMRTHLDYEAESGKCQQFFNDQLQRNSNLISSARASCPAAAAGVTGAGAVAPSTRSTGSVGSSHSSHMHMSTWCRSVSDNEGSGAEDDDDEEEEEFFGSENVDDDFEDEETGRSDTVSGI